MATRQVYRHQFVDSGLPLDNQTLGLLPAYAFSRISRELAHWDKSGFSFNNVSDRPRNPAQLADAAEMEAMEYFLGHPGDDVRFVPFSTSDGELYYHYSRPLRGEDYCLKCHGERAAAPETIRTRYDAGYGYRVGELRGILSIKIPARAMLEQEEYARTLRGSAESPLIVLNDKGLEFVCRIADDVPDQAVGDPARLRQILNHLLGNAVKFTERGGIELAVFSWSTTIDELRTTLVRCIGTGSPPTTIERRVLMTEVILESALTCPVCSHRESEYMPLDACLYFYECRHCRTLLRPKAGDCCVFCSYGTVPCPPIQADARKGNSCACSTSSVSPAVPVRKESGCY